MRVEHEALKLVAMNKVLRGLGGESYSLIERYLQQVEGISLEPTGFTSCSFEQLHGALQLLLGERTAAILLERIYIEADWLTEVAKR